MAHDKALTQIVIKAVAQATAIGGLLAAVLFMPLGGLIAQEFKDLKTPKTPLILKSQGSFFVGGKTIFSDGLQGTPPIFPEVITFTGEHQINQMYVRYMVPLKSSIPVVLVHGGSLTGKSYETTPDGRVGWDEYFVRSGHSAYVVDQVGRGRSGFDHTIINRVALGDAPVDTLPNFMKLSADAAWELFRFGPSAGVPYKKVQFPVKFMEQFGISTVGDPCVRTCPTFRDPVIPETIKSLAALAQTLGGAVVIGHSQAGAFPLDAAVVNPRGVHGAVVMEPGGCNATVYTASQISLLAKIPILILFGDYLNEGKQVIRDFWQPLVEDCRQFAKRINAARGNAKLVILPNAGVRGNSHMLMQDKNHLEVADLIIKWIDKEVSRKRRDHGHGR